MEVWQQKMINCTTFRPKNVQRDRHFVTHIRAKNNQLKSATQVKFCLSLFLAIVKANVTTGSDDINIF